MESVVKEKNITLIKKEDKYIYIEVLRVIACFAVILLHTVSHIMTNSVIFETSTWKLANFINATTRFAVPVFLMISGFLSLKSKKEESILEFLKKRFIRLVIPLFAWSIVYYVVNGIEANAKLSIIDFLFKFITMDVSYHLWFMYTLIAIELFVPIFKVTVQNLNRKYLWYFFFITILPTTILPMINKFSGIWLFRFEAVILGYFGYFLLGYLLGTADITKINRRILYVFGIFAICISYFGCIMLSSKEGIDTFFNGGYTFNSYLIATAVFLFAKYNFNNIKNKVITKLVTNLGALSFGIYLVHVLILNFLRNHLSNGHVISEVSLSIPTFIISASIVWIIKQIKRY